MLCEECIHAVSIYPGCIDCTIGYDPYWDDKEDCEKCAGYISAPQTDREYDFAAKKGAL